MVDEILAERGTTSNGRPPDGTHISGTAPGNRILRFGERAEQMEQERASQTSNDRLSNTYEGNPKSQEQPGLSHSPDGSSLTRADLAGNTTRHSGHTQAQSNNQSDHDLSEQFEPPNPPNLTSQTRGRPFDVSRTAVARREVIKLSIEFPLRQGNNRNNIALFFKKIITVLFTANTEILLTKWIPGDKNPI